MRRVAVIAVAMMVAASGAMAAKSPDQQAFELCMRTKKNSVALTCSFDVLQRCVQRTKDRVKCDMEDQDRVREQGLIDTENLIRKSDACMVEWSKAYALATQEQVSNVIEAAFTKCSQYTTPLANVMTNMSQSQEGVWADTYKKKFTATVMDARIKVGSGVNAPIEQPASKSF